jgi:hypothetical protein
MSQRPKRSGARDEKDRHAEPTSEKPSRSNASPAEVLAAIPTGAYDRYRQFMEVFEDRVNGAVLEQVLRKAIGYRSDNREDAMRRCLYNIALIQGCMKAGDDWSDYVDDLEDGNPKASADFSNARQGLEARLRQRPMSDSIVTASQQDVSVAQRPRTESLVYRRRDDTHDTHNVANTGARDGRNQTTHEDAPPALQKMFIPGAGVHTDLIDEWAHEHFGRDASVEPAVHGGKNGYFLTARRIATEDLLKILLADSKEYSAGGRRRGDDRHKPTRTEMAGRHDDVAASDAKGTQRPHGEHNESHAGLRQAQTTRPRQSVQGSVDIPVRRQSEPEREGGHAGRHQSSGGRPRWPASQMSILKNLEVSSKDYDNVLPLQWAELDHGCYGKVDNLISLACFHIISGGVNPTSGAVLKMQYRPGDTRYGTRVWLDLAWPGDSAENVCFMVEEKNTNAYGVVLGQTIIDRHDLLSCRAKGKMPLEMNETTVMHVHARRITEEQGKSNIAPRRMGTTDPGPYRPIKPPKGDVGSRHGNR